MTLFSGHPQFDEHYDAYIEDVDEHYGKWLHVHINRRGPSGETLDGYLGECRIQVQPTSPHPKISTVFFADHHFHQQWRDRGWTDGYKNKRELHLSEKLGFNGIPDYDFINFLTDDTHTVMDIFTEFTELEQSGPHVFVKSANWDGLAAYRSLFEER